MVNINEVLDLEQIDSSIFRGKALGSAFKRTFGGQVAAQSLVAAVATVDSDRPVHSLHGYFIAPGDATKPTVYLVDKLRDGRSFCTRRVQAVQNGETIFCMNASFHRTDDVGLEHSDSMREVVFPEELEGVKEALPPQSRAVVEEWTDWDIRVVPPGRFTPNPYSVSQQVVWFKSLRTLPDDPTFHACTLAYMSDMTLLHAALVPHPGHKVQMASLDHAIWFLRPIRADQWLLYDQFSPSAAGGRALTHGRIFDQHGNLVAVVTQEGLTRTLREVGE